MKHTGGRGVIVGQLCSGRQQFTAQAGQCALSDAQASVTQP